MKIFKIGKKIDGDDFYRFDLLKNDGGHKVKTLFNQIINGPWPHISLK
jgi:hypothetical protein